MTLNLSSVCQHQVERLQEIGEHLRQVRENERHSIEEMAQRTVIQARILRAIESGERHQLPEAVYVQGFIRRYADALGLDGTAIAEQFPDEEVMALPQKQTSWQESPAAQLRPFHLYAAYVALIMVSIGWLSSIMGRAEVARSPGSVNSVQTATAPVIPGEVSKIPGGLAAGAIQRSPASVPSSNQAAATDKTTAPAAPDQSAQPQPKTQSEPQSKPQSSVLAAAKPVRVDIKLIDQSWLEVESDGKTEFEGVLAEGTQQTWTAKSQVRVRAGNAGAVIVAQNGGKQKPLGEPGAVEEVTFSVDRNSASLPESASPITVH
jgi:cytoskeletal protein RodZ